MGPVPSAKEPIRQIKLHVTFGCPDTMRCADWSITLDFEIIKGKAAMESISIHKIYDGAFRYGDSSRSIETDLKPIIFTAHAEAQLARLRIVQTGHGMDKPDGCGEFCNKYRELWFDDKLINRKSIWKECGENPLYPQAGTWVFDRAGWCPGYLMQPDLYDLNVRPGQQHKIDVNMEPYKASTPSAEEVISAYLIQYKRPAAQYDVRIDNVIAPSSKDDYRRFNPSIIQPKILVRNLGKATITAMDIRYGTMGFSKKRFQWKGTLASGTVDTVALPGTIDSKEGLNEFEVEIMRVNGKKDVYAPDNKTAVPFKAAPGHDSTLVVYLLTNNQPAQNGYMLRNSDGDVIKKRDSGSLDANTVYRDTIVLAKGRYRFTINDTAGNGLEFCANARGGRGKLRLLNGKGEMIKDFESDFGSFVQYDFEVGAGTNTVAPQPSYGLYPTRTNDKTTFDFFANTPQDVVVQIVTDPGEKVVEEHRYAQLKEALFTYDLSRFPKGRFYFKAIINGEEEFKKRIRLKE